MPQWLVRVTENILSVTKFSADGVKLKLTEEVVEEIVGSAITKFRKTGGSISIQVHKPQDILLVPMEATLIEQVLLNLLENVVFHGKCATRIDIDIAEEPSRVCFHVSDNGAGISEGILPHLFDGSYAAQDGTARDDSRNMGIGLSVCPVHRGRPRRRDVGAEQPLRRRDPILLAPKKRRHRTIMNVRDKVLIVEDDEGIRKFLSTTLIANGYSVILADDGTSALELVPSHCPVCILLDLGLPDIDGNEIIRSIRSWTSIPILVISARTTEDDKAGALDLGADDYLTKPFSTVELLARIRTALRHARTPAGNDELSLTGSYHVGELTVDMRKHRVFLAGRDVGLTPNEFRIVSLLAAHAGQVLTYKYILRELWGPAASSDNKILRVHMANIRRKLEPNPDEPIYLFTEVGVGYRMADSEDFPPDSHI